MSVQQDDGESDVPVRDHWLRGDDATMPTRSPREFQCAECRARCTASPRTDREFGHGDCSHRPEDLPKANPNRETHVCKQDGCEKTFRKRSTNGRVYCPDHSRASGDGGIGNGLSASDEGPADDVDVDLGAFGLD